MCKPYLTRAVFVNNDLCVVCCTHAIEFIEFPKLNHLQGCLAITLIINSKNNNIIIGYLILCIESNTQQNIDNKKHNFK